MMKWYELIKLNGSPLNEITAEARVPAESPWFSGHFPGDPILPGIAQLSIVKDVITQQSGKTIMLSKLKKIRFKQIIRPDDVIKITIAPDKANPVSYAFSISVRGEIACSGIAELGMRSEE